MKHKFLIMVIGVALLAVSTSVALAETGSVNISGGSLSLVTDSVDLGSVTLTGQDQIAASEVGVNWWSATDARGTGEGWNLTIVATDFTDGGTPLRTIDISSTNQEFMIQLPDANIWIAEGNTKPISLVNALTAIPESPAPALKFISAAADTGMGTYGLNPGFALEIPAQTYVGTGAYTATITVSAVSGP